MGVHFSGGGGAVFVERKFQHMLKFIKHYDSTSVWFVVFEIGKA